MMNEDWRNELVTKGAAFDALTEIENQYEFEDGHDHLMGWAKTKIFALPSAQPDKRLEKIADLVDGTIDHFDRDDAMDLLYQIKEVLK